MAKTLTALTGAALMFAGTTDTAGAIIAPTYTNTARYTVAQDEQWETMSNLPMVDAFAMAPYGWRAGFRIRVGARWDSGLFYGASWGNVEARMQLWVDTPRGPATMRSKPALAAVHVVPAYTDQSGRGGWLTDCQGHADGWNVEPVAQLGHWACSAPTDAGPHTNYAMGAYSACVVVSGLAFADQPSSWFHASTCPRPAQRV
jgi:hypothetical protein